MIKLYGFGLSNYFNMVKLALIEKGLDYEVVEVKPNQTDEFLKISPMGKVPCIETQHGFLSESNVILEYLEDLGTGPSFFPADPFEKAKVRELMKEIELYIELPARTCFAEAFFGGKVTDEVKDKAKADLKKGIDCLKRNASFAPYVAGSELTYADFILMYSIGLAGACAKRVLGMDLLAELPEVRELVDKLSERASARQVTKEQQA